MIHTNGIVTGWSKKGAGNYMRTGCEVGDRSRWSGRIDFKGMSRAVSRPILVTRRRNITIKLVDVQYTRT